MNVNKLDSKIIIKNSTYFSPELSLDCGQAFRWENQNGIWHGVVGDKVLNISTTEKEIIFDTTEQDFENIWTDYFDLNRNYDEIVEVLKQDEYFKAAHEEFKGIRILNQEPWETLCSFIISQNNNIPRIKGIINRLCENFGEKITDNDYTFPSADVISNLTLDDLAPLRAGFRSKYILDAAQKVASGDVNLEILKDIPIEQAREELIKIKGVGKKVAECTLLYGCRHIDAFPVDVWVNRVLGEMYPDDLPECMNGYRGIAQQYLFHWRRYSEQFNK